MNKKRLLKLADLLDVVPPEKFDMGVWGFTEIPMGSSPKCATRACALGWATAIPEFYKAGLRLVAEPGAEYADILFGGSHMKVGERFFRISEDQAYRLFHRGVDDPKAKAAEIRALVRAAPR